MLFRSAIRRIEHRYERIVGTRRVEELKRALRELFEDHRERKGRA